MMPLEKIILLNQVSLFADLPTDQIRAIAEIAEEDYRKSGELLYAQGDDAARLYMLVSGQIEIKGQPIYSAKDVLGVTNLFGESIHSIEALCLIESEFLFIDRDEIESLILQIPVIGISLLRVFSKDYG